MLAFDQPCLLSSIQYNRLEKIRLLHTAAALNQFNILSNLIHLDKISPILSDCYEMNFSRYAGIDFGIDKILFLHQGGIPAQDLIFGLGFSGRVKDILHLLALKNPQEKSNLLKQAFMGFARGGHHNIINRLDDSTFQKTSFCELLIKEALLGGHGNLAESLINRIKVNKRNYFQYTKWAIQGTQSSIANKFINHIELTTSNIYDLAYIAAQAGHSVLMFDLINRVNENEIDYNREAIILMTAGLYNEACHKLHCLPRAKINFGAFIEAAARNGDEAVIKAIATKYQLNISQFINRIITGAAASGDLTFPMQFLAPYPQNLNDSIVTNSTGEPRNQSCQPSQTNGYAKPYTQAYNLEKQRAPDTQPGKKVRFKL